MTEQERKEAESFINICLKYSNYIDIETNVIQAQRLLEVLGEASRQLELYHHTSLIQVIDEHLRKAINLISLINQDQ